MERPHHRTIGMRGGLNLEDNPTEIKEGSLILCKNILPKQGGGYYRIPGYERYDGQPSPTESVDPIAARALINPVPGSGPIRGVWVYEGDVYAFRDTADGLNAKMHKATATGWQEITTPALQPGGKYRFCNFNFYADTEMNAMFGVDGKNKAFRWDGTTYTELTVTGESASMRPKHVLAHMNHLFLGYDRGQWVHSNIGDPMVYNGQVGGAATGGVGDEIVAMRSLVGGVLGFFMRGRIDLLYGSSASDWSQVDVRPQSEQSGAVESSVVTIGNDVYYLDDRGLTTLKQTQSFGNFKSGTIDRKIKRFILDRRNKVVGSCISRANSQYRIFFDHPNGTEMLALTIGDSSHEGYGVALYPFKLTSIVSAEINGEERIFAGADNGMVYELDKGVSFDGADIESYAKLNFLHLGSPAIRKRFRQAYFGFETQEPVTVRVKPEFDYASNMISPHEVMDHSLFGGGGLWSLDKWNEFNWSSQVVEEANVDITGTGRNMSLLIYHKGQTKPFIIYDVTIQYSPRRHVR